MKINSNKKSIKEKRTKRGYGKKNLRKQGKGCNYSKFCILGTNANGLFGKQESLKNAVNIFQPSAITIQESKLTRMGKIKLLKPKYN